MCSMSTLCARMPMFHDGLSTMVRLAICRKEPFGMKSVRGRVWYIVLRCAHQADLQRNPHSVS